MSSGPDIGSPFSGSPDGGKRGPIPPPPGATGPNGPRISPDVRNGDFLSRLLAATPPYLYNIPLVPQSFFFSDMLKSFVQSSNNNNNNGKSNEPPPMPPLLKDSRDQGQMEFPNTDMISKDLPGRPPHRRRKRTWREVSEPPRFMIDRKPPPILDKPLELTTSNKHHSSPEEKVARHEGPSTPILSSSPPMEQNRSPPATTTSPPILPPPPPPLMLPNLPHCGMLPLPDFGRLPSDSSSLSNELLPSHLPPFPPPLWYPSMYPGLGGPSPHPQPPYGIDPLHFFIDLRVSGHIWDRKLPPFGTVPSPMSPPQAGLDCTIDRERRNGTPVVTELEKESDAKCAGVLNLSSSSNNNNKPGLNLLLGMKNSKHSSAFSVPEPKPLMLSPTRGHSRRSEASSPNANYVLHNLKRIYKSVKIEDSDEVTVPEEPTPPPPEVKKETEEAPKEEEGEETGEDGKKKEKCKDLPALIGLELVVDYVKHEAKPGVKRTTPPTTPPTGDAAPTMLAVTPEPEQAASP